MLGRNINRHNYTLDEVRQEVRKPVVERLLKLMEFRNSYPAFNGDFSIKDTSQHELILAWVKRNYAATAYIDLQNHTAKITYTDPVASRTVDFHV